ncbi:pilin [Patescibacteria group bacterium]|nr:pilin [Patescibacteria group bacterium]MBU1721247.1 pilin [Patescibacteria group bacterium]MBU1901045.1 pilin [Patescibacteria group bacterium]
MKRFFFFSLLAGLFITATVSAQGLVGQINEQISAAAGAAGMGVPVPPQLFVAELIRLMLGFIGTIFFVLVLMSGYWLLTARDNEEKVSKARDTIKRAIIGLFVIMVAYSITTFVARSLSSNIAGKVYRTTDMQVDCGLWSMVRNGDFNCQLKYKN